MNRWRNSITLCSAVRSLDVWFAREAGGGIRCSVRAWRVNNPICGARGLALRLGASSRAQHEHGLVVAQGGGAGLDSHFAQQALAQVFGGQVEILRVIAGYFPGSVSALR